LPFFSEINDSEEAKKTIWYQANFDALTGLPNRSMFLYRLEKELQDIERTHMPLALMFLDLDHFKEINDTLGHDKGDILLQEAARRISLCVRKNDIVARLGGDEFTIIISQINSANIIDTIANAILSELSHAFKLNGELSFVSASIGITIAPTDGTQVETLVINADQAMYEAKKDGRNRYRYFKASMQDSIQKRMKLINNLRDALESKQFILYYQPIMDAKTGEIHKAEALIRWQNPDGTIISPSDFIPLAEETGLIVQMGEWVFKEAVQRVSQWRNNYDPSFQITVNKSPVQFRDDNEDCLVLVDYLEHYNLPSDAIIVEITEGILMEQTPLIQDRLKKLELKGIELSLDDFGTGYSSLSYLKKFEIDYLKIDQSFVKNLHADINDKVLCEAITAMAHKLEIKVVAEGVELQEQADFLQSIGCDFLQGYWISRPIPADEFEKKFLKITI
jgi:diguanylate cyclase (GGDEF)-like protein